MKMKTVYLLVGWLFAFSCFAGETERDYIYNQKIAKRFKITQTSPYKDHYVLPMRYFITILKTNNVDNHFCVIGYQLANKKREGVVFWSEGKVLIRWWLEGRELDNLFIDAGSMLDSPSISYENIVPLAEITTQMALYAKEDVEPMRADCQRNGETIVIKSFPMPTACRDKLWDGGTECIDALNAIK
jgi:hypothetical protein